MSGRRLPLLSASGPREGSHTPVRWHLAPLAVGVVDTGDGAACVAWAGRFSEELSRLGRPVRVGAVVPQATRSLGESLAAALARGGSPRLWSLPLRGVPDELADASGPPWLLVGEPALRHFQPRLSVLLGAELPPSRWSPGLLGLRGRFELELAGDGLFVVGALAARIAQRPA